MKKIDNFLFRGNYNRKSINPDLCARGVTDNDRGAMYHQCFNKPAKQIQGYGFCHLHAVEIETALGLNADEGVDKYVCGRSYLGVYIELVRVLKETDKLLTVSSVKELYGNKHHSASTIKKNDVWAVFDTAREATEWAVEVLRSKANASKREMEEYSAQADRLERKLKQ